LRHDFERVKISAASGPEKVSLLDYENEMRKKNAI
jgi:hypothetical protein